MRRTVLVGAGVASALVVATAGTAGVKALITGAQIKDGTIESRDIDNGSIRRADLSGAAIASLRGGRGPAGATGPRGATGTQGPAGPQGAAGPQGPQGPAGSQGAAGAAGPPGAGVNVTGSVATAAALPATGDPGDAYIVTATGHLHVWDGSAWIDTGLVQGPAGPQGATGAAGPQGPAGPAGSAGPAGAPGALAGYQIVTGVAFAIAASDFDVSGSVDCPAGKVAVGGGVTLADPGGGVALLESSPKPLGAGWNVTVGNFSEDPNSATPYAICAASA